MQVCVCICLVILYSASYSCKFHDQFFNRSVAGWILSSGIVRLVWDVPDKLVLYCVIMFVLQSCIFLISVLSDGCCLMEDKSPLKLGWKVLNYQVWNSLFWNWAGICNNVQFAAQITCICHLWKLHIKWQLEFMLVYKGMHAININMCRFSLINQWCEDGTERK